MGKPRRQTIWIDSARTRTAADISEVGECQAFIRRISRNIEDLLQQGAGQPDCPRNLQQALHYRNLALRELESRYSQLIQQR